MTIYFQMSLKDSVKHFVHLLSDSPLEIFQIYSAVLSLDCPVADELWTQLLLTHGKRLLQISVHRTLISWEVIHIICVQCTKLEQLCLVVDRDFMVRILAFSPTAYSKSCAQDKLGSCLSFAKALKTIHFNYNIRTSGPSLFPRSQALSILNKCSPTVTQFGCNSRVWQVSSD